MAASVFLTFALLDGVRVAPYAVDACAARQPSHLLGEVVIVHDSVAAAAPRVRRLGLGAGRADHQPRASLLAELTQQRAHPTGRSLHEDLLRLAVAKV